MQENALLQLHMCISERGIIGAFCYILFPELGKLHVPSRHSSTKTTEGFKTVLTCKRALEALHSQIA